MPSQSGRRDTPGLPECGPEAAAFGCAPAAAGAAVHRLVQAGRRVQHAILSRWVDGSSRAGPAPGVEVCVVDVDVPAAELMGVIEPLIAGLIYPTYAAGRRVCLYCRPPRHALLGCCAPEDLHADVARLGRGLLVEQLLDLAAAGPRRGPALGPRARPVEAELDANQERAARHLDGPIRVLAPAGSGKTKTLISRVAHLVGAGIDPSAILALAFNRKAAVEMSQRLLAKGVPVASRLAEAGVAVRTFHSLGFEIVKAHLGWSMPEEPGDGDTRRALQEAAAAAYPGPGNGSGLPPQRLMAALTAARMDLVRLDAITLATPAGAVPFGPVFEGYCRLQERRRFVDFDDMIYLALRALLRQRGLRRRLRQRFAYLLVDEFQDLNRAQMLLLRVLALPRNNLFAVGDDDQLIYGWRGAVVDHILRFSSYFPGADDCLLSTNYRSARRVVRHARWLIDHNRRRVAKDIRPRPGAAEGSFELCVGKAPEDQVRCAVTWIARLGSSPGVRWSDFAVLYRTKAHRAAMAAALEGAGIPHTGARGETADGVALSTIHSTKGNQYRYAVYLDASDPVDASPEELEEERRVAYVAVTRAVDRVLVTAPGPPGSRMARELALNPEYGRVSRWRLWLAYQWRRCAGRGRPSPPAAAALAELAAELRHRRALGRRRH